MLGMPTDTLQTASGDHTVKSRSQADEAMIARSDGLASGGAGEDPVHMALSGANREILTTNHGSSRPVHRSLPPARPVPGLHAQPPLRLPRQPRQGGSARPMPSAPGRPASANLAVQDGRRMNRASDRDGRHPLSLLRSPPVDPHRARAGLRRCRVTSTTTHLRFLVAVSRAGPPLTSRDQLKPHSPHPSCAPTSSPKPPPSHPSTGALLYNPHS